MPITVGRDKSITTVEHALQSKASIGIVLPQDAAVDDPGVNHYATSFIANVIRHIESEDETHHAVCQGAERFQIKAALRHVGTRSPASEFRLV